MTDKEEDNLDAEVMDIMLRVEQLVNENPNIAYVINIFDVVKRRAKTAIKGNPYDLMYLRYLGKHGCDIVLKEELKSESEYKNIKDDMRKRFEERLKHNISKIYNN